MSVRRPLQRVLLIATWLVLMCIAPAAADETEAQALRAALATLTTEQQALYQQFQMVQALRLNEQRFAFDAYGPPSGPPRNYDDVVREQQAAADRADAYQADMDDLYERYRELERQKGPLLQRLRELSLGASEP